MTGAQSSAFNDLKLSYTATNYGIFSMHIKYKEQKFPITVIDQVNSKWLYRINGSTNPGQVYAFRAALVLL